MAHLWRFAVAFIAELALMGTVVFCFALRSVTTGWRDDQWGSDGWAFTAEATLAAFVAAAAMTVGAHTVVIRWRPLPVVLGASAVALVVGIVVSMASAPGLIVPVASVLLATVVAVVPLAARARNS